MGPIELVVGLSAAFVIFVIFWQKKEIFPYLLIGTLGLEYFSGTSAERLLTVPKVGFVALVFYQLILGRWRLRLFRYSILPALCVYALFFSLTFFWSVAPERSLIRAITLVALLAAVTVVVSSVDNIEDVHRFFRAFVLFGAANAVVAVVQISQGLLVFDEELGGRVGGIGANPTEGAFYLCLALLISLGYHLNPQHARRWISIWVVRVGLIALLMVGLLLTGSRGGLLAMLLAICVLLFASRRSGTGGSVQKARRVLVAVVLVSSVLLLMAGSRQMFSNRISAMGEDQFGNRFAIWGQVWEGIAAQPIFGHGLNSVSITTGKYDDTFTYSTHNVMLTALLDGGIVGFLVMLYAGWVMLRAIKRLSKHGSDAICFVGLLLEAIGICTVVIMLSHDLGLNKLLWVLVGLVEGMNLINLSVPAATRHLVKSGQVWQPMTSRHAKA